MSFCLAVAPGYQPLTCLLAAYLPSRSPHPRPGMTGAWRAVAQKRGQEEGRSHRAARHCLLCLTGFQGNGVSGRAWLRVLRVPPSADAVSSFHTPIVSSDHNLSFLHSQSFLLSTERVLTLCREKGAQGAIAVPLGTSPAPPQSGRGPRAVDTGERFPYLGPESVSSL